ncbi:MAG: IPT/TIG domain-containing protein [Pyrinomonadaceae bacterium]
MAIAILVGKTSTERNKIIAAGILGVVSLIALYMAFGSVLFGSKSSTTVSVKTAPVPKTTSTSARPDTVLPTLTDQQFLYETTPVVYNPGSVSAPDAGRNIFAFYEPPPHCKDCPVPTPKPTEIRTPSPTPTPPFLLASINPQNVYAGSAAFRIELNGDRFAPDARIYFNQTELPTTFVSPQKLTANIPASLIAQEGPRQVIVQTPDGKSYSEQLIFSIQPPPQPSFQYVGMIGRKRNNNDTAYFTETGKTSPYGARLNDVLAGRFRLIDISPAQVVLEDVNLGFKHRLAISRAAGATAQTGRGNPAPQDNGFVPFDPSTIPQNIPGIPNNIPRYIPPNQVQQPQRSKDDKATDVDDKGDE